jgi:hypothetical protein
MNEIFKCRLCGKEYSYHEMSEEHYPAHSTGNDDIVAFDVIKMFDQLMSGEIADELINRIQEGSSIDNAAEDIFDNELAKPMYPKGRTARTLCKSCNTFLGRYDEAYLKFFKCDGNPKVVKGFQPKTKLRIPVCLDNIATRGDFKAFDIGLFADVKPTHIKRDFKWYRSLDNGTRLNKLNVSEQYQAVIDLPANRFLRNGIGHNNVKYDSITQIVTAFDLRKPNKIKYQNSLMSVAVDCIGLARSAVIMSEMILYILRQEFRTEGIRTVMHPRFYKGIEPNMKCPCGSGIKYKKCCRTEVDQLLYMAEKEKKTQ